MPTEPSEHLAGWDSVRNALTEVRATHGEFQQFFSEVFDQLDELLTELAGRRRQWESDRQQTESELARQAAQLKEDRAALSAQRKQPGKDAQAPTGSTKHLKRLLKEVQQERAEIRDSQQAVQAQVARLADAGGDDRLEQMLEEIRQQRAELRGAQEAAQTQAEQLAAVAAELTNTRSELTQEMTPAGDDQLGQMLEEIRQQRAELHGAQEAAQTQAEQLAAVAAELTNARSELTQEMTPAGDDQLGQMLEEIRQQRAEWQRAQEASQTQAEQLAAAAAKLTDARCELVEARNEIAQRWEQLQARQGEAAQPRPDEELQERFRQMEHQRALLEQERTVLESELEAVRNRAAEMTESLAEQRQQAGAQRAEWADELKRMRRLLEGISGRLAEGERSGRSLQSDFHEPVAVAAGEGSTAANGDPVLASVAAQFEMLQRDLARRRAARSERQGVAPASSDRLQKELAR